MKLRVFCFVLLVAVLLPVSLVGCVTAFAEEGVLSNDIPAEGLQVISTALDAIKLSGVNATSMGNHGANQNRVVSVSSGMYLGVMLTPKDEYTKDCVQATMIRVNPDGTAETIYKDFIAGGSTTVTIMADNNEDIWMYSAWSVEPYSYFKVWHYDVSENNTTAYESVQFGGDLGYSVAMMDAENDRIFALAPGGDVPGSFTWCEFDMVKKEWLPKVKAEIPYRCCYDYMYPDGNGGVYIVGERDIQNRSVESNIPKLSVVDAMSQLRSRKIDADYMWDELYLMHIPDLSVANVDFYPIEYADYDVENGIYPNIKNNGCGDTFLDSKGYLHTIYTTDDDAVAGIYMNHKVYDTSTMEVIYAERITFLYGDNVSYNARMFEDLEGNVYILAMPLYARSQVEVWKSVNDTNTQYKLVHNENLEGLGNNPVGGGMILANNRNNSKPSNTASFILDFGGTWNAYTIDLAPFANK